MRERGTLLRRQAMCTAIALFCLGAAGCPPKNDPPGPSVEEIWGRRRTSLLDIDANTNEPIATVNAVPLRRQGFEDLLVQMYGLDLLDIEIRLQLAKSAAAEKGVEVSPADIDAEYERNLHKLWSAGDGGQASAEPFDRTSAEAVLDQVLKQKGVARDQFMLKVQMDAYLRKIAEPTVTMDNKLLTAERERTSGERVSVRHIQLNSLRTAQMVREKLDSGESFEELARRESVNPITAASGGLLPPFTRGEKTIPVVIRERAFALSPGEVSNIIQVGRQYQILKLEERLPPETPEADEAAEATHKRLHDRMVQEAMEREAARLFDSAQIVIHDKELNRQFRKRYHKGAAVQP